MWVKETLVPIFVTSFMNVPLPNLGLALRGGHFQRRQSHKLCLSLLDYRQSEKCYNLVDNVARK